MNRFRRAWQLRQKDTAVLRARHVKRLGEDRYQTGGRNTQVAQQPIVDVSVAKQSPVELRQITYIISGVAHSAMCTAVAAASWAWPERGTGRTGKASRCNRFIV